MPSRNNKKDDYLDFLNDFIKYRSVLKLEKFRQYFSEKKIFSGIGIIESIYKITSYFIFEILKIAEQFFQTKIYFNFEQPEIFLTDNNLPQHLIVNGVIKEIRYGIACGIYPDEPRLYHYNAKLGDISLHSDARRQFCHNASGNSFNDNHHAFLRTIGEAAERFCLDCYRDKDLITVPYRELKNQAVNPSLVSALSPEQRNRQKHLIIDEKSVFRWVKGYSLQTGKTMWLPAQLVYISYNRIPNEPIIMLPISTGAAAWYSLEGAIYRALCEAIERDAFMVFYLNKISPPQFNLDGIKNPKTANLLDILKRYRLEVHLLDITTDIQVPVVLAMILDRSGVGPPISIGASANLNILQAVESAIMEAMKIRISSRQLFDKMPADLKIKPSEIFTFHKRQLFWRNSNLINQIDFLLNGPIRELCDEDTWKDNKDNIRELKKVSDCLNKVGIESFMVDITIPPVKKAGLFVVKIIAPKLQPLYLNENLRYLGSERLYQVPVKMGWREKPLKEEELNSLPHPFI